MSAPYPNGLPAVMARYGNPLEYVNDKRAWEDTALVLRALVYPLPYAYGDAEVTHLRAHHVIADELVALLARACEATPDRSRLRYGGTYCWRPMRGSTRLSLHTWGIAIDLDPARNAFETPWDPNTGLPVPVVELFEAAGWTAGARWARPDPMHLQAASGT